MNTFRKTTNFIISRFAAVALAVGGFSVLNTCTLFFHEEEMPKELQEHHPFLKNDNY
ncbi:cyclic lactone autoinducer peptide [Sporosarcina obsidiansis]|uniref:cyclic lactone autoinducer peptide n=1 Tax=Sporosarcina obsidiansis TaxID=2660748 RepID=UPI00129C0B7B|nr:cyclic lactone autoinducer peptide [Sporosarcina obsidiansis]